MQDVPPYRLTEPAADLAAIVFSSPHSGSEYPDALIERTRLSPLALRGSEDVLVDDLFGAAPDHGAPLLAATMPRAWLDLNRGAGELDPALVRGARSAGLNQRVAAGLGVIPRIVAEGTPIYDGKISMAEAEARIRAIHAPYHEMLDSLLLRARRRFGAALLIDCHSMPTEALRATPRVNGKAPEIVLGDRFGASASRDLVDQVWAAFERQDFVVARNTPFAGGYITQRFGRPSRSLHAVQIEIDRSLYLDQAKVKPLPDYDAFKARLSSVVAEIAGIMPGSRAMAAE